MTFAWKLEYMPVKELKLLSDQNIVTKHQKPSYIVILICCHRFILEYYIVTISTLEINSFTIYSLKLPLLGRG